ncbi:NADPH-dependent F420 reductase [Pelagibius sp.]|uniref:NADPH-dependent F420 reductase n=1 Tax=Pelagibius sp. TaxID=1931238 RepID=UPI003B502941
MRIGIIGAGAIGQTYAKLWSAAEHEVFLSSRNPEKLVSLVQDIGANVQAGTTAQAAQFGEVILLAVNYSTVGEAVNAIRPYVEGKLVIDATNPLRQKEDGGTERVIEDDQIAGMVMADMLPEARIAKGLTTLWTGYVERHANVADPTIAMTLAGDDAKDRETVAQLIRDAGLVPVDLGRLAQSRPLDPPSPIWNVVLTAEELEAQVDEFRRKTAEET